MEVAFHFNEGAVFDKVEIAGETDEYPCESIVDVHVVIGVNAEYSKKIVYEFVSFLSVTELEGIYSGSRR